jgi:hypothetical protein
MDVDGIAAVDASEEHLGSIRSTVQTAGQATLMPVTPRSSAARVVVLFLALVCCAAVSLS